MGEYQKLLVKKISYTGLFNYKELFRIMDFWLRDKFYDKFERRNEEYHTDRGIQMVTEFKPWKKVTDYYKIIIKIQFHVIDTKKVEVVRNGKKVQMDDGRVDIKLTGYFIPDYEGWWSKNKNKPFHYFLRDIFERFVYWYITRKYQGMCIDHVNDLYHHLSTYLNVTPYKVEA